MDGGIFVSGDTFKNIDKQFGVDGFLDDRLCVRMVLGCIQTSKSYYGVAPDGDV